MELNFEEYCGYYLLKDVRGMAWYNIYRDVTDKAKYIFGDGIITRAFLAVSYGINKKEDAKKKIRNGIPENLMDIGCIDVDGTNLIVRFANGRYVWFYTSESGDIHDAVYEGYNN